MKFSGVITTDRRYVHAKGHGQRSKVKVTQAEKSTILAQIGGFRTVTLQIEFTNGYEMMYKARNSI